MCCYGVFDIKCYRYVDRFKTVEDQHRGMQVQFALLISGYVMQ